MIDNSERYEYTVTQNGKTVAEGQANKADAVMLAEGCAAEYRKEGDVQIEIRKLNHRKAKG